MLGRKSNLHPPVYLKLKGLKIEGGTLQHKIAIEIDFMQVSPGYIT